MKGLSLHQVVLAQRVDDVHLNATADDLLRIGFAESLEDYNPDINWRTNLRIDDDLRCYVCDGILQCIFSESSLLLNEINVIGISADALISLLGAPDELSDWIDMNEVDQQRTYEYPKLGLQIWADVRSVVVGAYVSDPELIK